MKTVQPYRRSLMSCLATIALATALPATPTTSRNTPTDGLQIDWNGNPISLETLENGTSNEQAVALQLRPYEQWAIDNGYHAALSADARVILITPSVATSGKRMLRVEATLKAFDSLMAPPDRSAMKETFRTAGWGVGEHRPDAEPVVLFEVKSASQYESLCEALAAQSPQLRLWAASVTQSPGFAQEQASAAAWQTAPQGYEVGTVWRPENELVNRLARLLLNRSFGPQPIWLQVSTAWRIEMQVMDSIYCFPYRQGFVGIGEHGGWKNDLKRTFKKRKKAPLAHTEFANWKRNTWDENSAMLSWGFVQFLAQEKPEVLPAVAEQFRLLYKAGSVVNKPDGTWLTKPGFSIPLEEQLRVLTESGGADLFSEATSFLRTWKVKRRTKKKRK